MDALHFRAIIGAYRKGADAMNKVIFWDVDGTLIDSDARFHAAVKAGNGVFNVAYYRERQTDVDLAADTALPLLSVALGNMSNEYVLTAREMLPADFRQLEAFGIKPIHIFHRGNAPAFIAAIQHNGDYKRAYINFLRMSRFYHIKEDSNGNWARIYDDDIGVLKMARKIGVIPHNAIMINELLREVA